MWPKGKMHLKMSILIPVGLQMLTYNIPLNLPQIFLQKVIAS